MFKKKSPEKFFQDVQKEANYVDIDNIKPIYYAIIRSILNNLRLHGFISLPDLGNFRIVVHKGRRSRDPNVPGQYIQLPDIGTVKFTPCDRLKEFAKKHKN